VALVKYTRWTTHDGVEYYCYYKKKTIYSNSNILKSYYCVDYKVNITGISLLFAYTAMIRFTTPRTYMVYTSKTSINELFLRTTTFMVNRALILFNEFLYNTIFFVSRETSLNRSFTVQYNIIYTYITPTFNECQSKTGICITRIPY